MLLLSADVVRDASGIKGDAVLVEGRRIAAVGRRDELAGRATREERYPGAVIVPGLRDAHLHPVGHAVAVTRPSLKAAADFGEVRDILSEEASRLGPGTAVTALRLDDETLAEGRLPDRHLLDEASREHPIVISRYCGHITIANTLALETAGVGPETPDPPGGVIDRDDQGRPTGVLRETPADLVTDALKERTAPVTVEQLAAASAGLAAVGLTAIGGMVAGCDGGWPGAGDEVEILCAAASDLAIPVRAMVAAADPAELRDAADRLGAAGPRVAFHGVKMFSDGSLGGHTAAMHSPFSDKNTVGTHRLDPAWAAEMGRASLDLGGVVAIHAIGDAAVARVLDVMQVLLDDGADPHRLRVEHLSVVAEEDLRRLADLGVIASVQPAFLTSETEWLEKRVGKERMARTYAFRTMADAGVVLAGGSDSPVEPPHPLWGMASARDRAGLVPEQALTAEEALRMFTEGAGLAIGREVGLSPATEASFTVLGGDPVTATPADVRAMQVVASWVEGEPTIVAPETVAWVA